MHSLVTLKENELDDLLFSNYINELNKEKIKSTIKLKEPIYKVPKKNGYVVLSLAHALQNVKNEQGNTIPLILISMIIFIFAVGILFSILNVLNVGFFDYIKYAVTDYSIQIPEMTKNKILGCFMYGSISFLILIVSVIFYLRLNSLKHKLLKTTKMFTKINRDSFEIFVDSKTTY